MTLPELLEAAWNGSRFRPVGEEEPLPPLSLTACERFTATLPAGDCATRHGARWPSGKRRGRPKFPRCHECPVGARVLERLRASGWELPRDSQPAEVMDNAQRAAKLAYMAAIPGLGEEDAGDIMRDAAAMTPDAKRHRQAEEW